MARQIMSERNTRKLAKKLNLPIKHILVRGGTRHRKDLILMDGKRLSLYPLEIKGVHVYGLYGHESNDSSEVHLICIYDYSGKMTTLQELQEQGVLE